MASFRVPRLQAGLGIVDAKGRPVPAFMRWWNMEVAPSIEAQFSDISDLIAQIQQVQVTQAEQLELINDALELAGLALETADRADPSTGTVSGSSSGMITLSGTSFTPVASVPLVDVLAGDLTIQGTAPLAYAGTTTVSPGGVMLGEYRIVEVVGGVDTNTVFTGLFRVSNSSLEGPDQVLTVNHISANAVSGFISARSTTGAVTYRIDARRTEGANIYDMGFYLFARRAA